MELKIKSIRWIIFLFSAIAILYYLFSDKIVSYVSTLNPIMIILVTSILDPVYVMFIYFLWKSFGLKGAFWGFVITTANSAISLPHVYLINGELSTKTFSLFTESTFFNLLPEFIKTASINLPYLGAVNIGVFLVYVVISIGLIILSLMFLHKKKFKDIFLRSI